MLSWVIKSTELLLAWPLDFVDFVEPTRYGLFEESPLFRRCVMIFMAVWYVLFGYVVSAFF